MKPILCAAVLITTWCTMACGKSTSPTMPSTSSITLSLAATTLESGATTQGTVSLAAAATTPMTVSLSTSDASVATVPATVIVAKGSTTATFTVSGVAPGTVTIAATLNGVSVRSSQLTVAAPRLAAITLSASTAVEGDAVTAMVTLTGAAPAGGAAVALSSAPPVLMPANVLVSAGASTAKFSVATRPGSGVTSVTVTATYGGQSASAVLSVTRPTVATARFGVSGPTETETCEMSSDGRTLICTFDASTSSAPGNIVSYDWSYSVAGTFKQTTAGAVLKNPTVDCGLMPSPPMPAGNPGWFTLTVTLTIRDDRGNVAQATDSGARLLPHGACGF
jgi:hypothetical protein